MTTYPPDLEEYVQGAISTGKFRDRDEFAVEAAKMYREMELRRAQLKSDIEAAIEESHQGMSEPLDIDTIKRELIDELDSQGRAK